MATGQNGAAERHIRVLFQVGTVGGLTDRQLLERFAERAGEESELAFAVLVERHGPMVHRVCRSFLVDPSDADDAVQATFLVLSRRAGSLHVRDSLRPWLHQVARRTAACARSAAARRRRHELAASGLSPRFAGMTVRQHDLAQILDDEVNRLPDRYRTVIVLCLVDGLTHRQAARQLGWPIGTVESRLARGREILQRRLTKRGLAPSAVILLGMGSPRAATLSVSAALAKSTVQIATRSTFGGSATTASIAALATEVINAMFASRLALFLVPVLVLALFVGAGAYRASLASGQTQAVVEAQVEPIEKKKAQSPAAQVHGPKLVAPSELTASTGRGSFLVFVLDNNRERTRVGDGSNGAYEEKLEEHRWAIVTGILNHDAVRDSLVRSARQAARPGGAATRGHPNYRRLDLERQEHRPGGIWSAWAEVDVLKNYSILENVPEVESEDRMPEQVRLDALVDPLPFLKVGSWHGADIWKAAKVEEPIARRKDIPPPAQRPAKRTLPLPFPTTEAPEILVRSLDFTIQPGFTYRYRVRIVIDTADGIGKRRELTGPWSEPTAPVTIPD
jgi:RNA polymerase sigma factor (sigma-70 family)